MMHRLHSSVTIRLLGVACAIGLAAWLARAQDPAPAAPPAIPAGEPATAPAAPTTAPATQPRPALRRLQPGIIRPGMPRPARTPGAGLPAPNASAATPAPAPAGAGPGLAPGGNPADAGAASGAVGLTGGTNAAAAADDTEPAAPALKFENAGSDIVLQAYAQETGRTLLLAPDAPKCSITLRSQTALTRREYLQAIQTALNMNGIALLPVGDKFLKVVSSASYRPAAPQTLFEEPETGTHEEMGQMISQMVQLKYITIEEVKGVLDGFKRPQGLILVFERTNSILITDAAENVNRMLEIIHFLDQPHHAREVVNVRPIKYAKAATIKQRLDDIVAESLKAQQAAKEAPQTKSAGSPGIVRTVQPSVPGVLRPPISMPSASAANNPMVEAIMDDAERGVIRGKVQILADERTNILIIITPPENMTFFDGIISVLDIETTPDVGVEVMRLEYADSEDVAKMLNDLIGNSKSDQQPKSTAQGAAGENKTAAGEAPKSENLASFAERVRNAAASTGSATLSETGKSKLGELSKDNIKILSNKRTNAVIVMASKSDTAAIKEIIKDMDIMLSQVLIETVVLDVSLTKELATGINWVQKSIADNNKDTFFGRGGAGKDAATPVTITKGADVSSLATNMLSAAAGIQYFFTLPNLNVNAVIQASASDNRTKVLTSPVLLTQDNKEATIESKKTVYLTKGSTPVSSIANGSTAVQTYYQPNVDAKDVGLTVKVTPRINQKGVVVLHVDETFEDQTGTQSVPVTDSSGAPITQDWPVISTRKLTADIAMKSGETVILGGLVTTSKSKSSTKVPILGDIPFIGRYLFGSTDDKEDRTELLVFMTPYVLDTAESMESEARRRKEYVNAEGIWTKGWSGSKLADETITQKIKRQKAEHAAERAGTNRPPMIIRSSGVMSSTVTTNTVAPAASAK